MTVVGAYTATEGFTVNRSEIAPGRLIVTGTLASPLTLAGPHAVVNIPAATLSLQSNVPVPVDQSMSYVEVRDAIRTAFAATFNPVTQSTNIDAWRFYDNTIQLYLFAVDFAGPMATGKQRVGDLFGPTGADYFEQANRRALNNTGEGIYIDDIIIGLAERGEMAVGASVTAPSMQLDPTLTNGGFVDLSAIPSGTYQLEIRTAANYIVPSIDPTVDPIVARTYDSNERLTQQLALVVENAGAFTDGATFTLSDGTNQATFEFNVVGSVTDRAVGVTPGNVALNIAPNATVADIARVIRNAINGPTVQAALKLKAGGDGDMPNGSGVFLNRDQSNVIQLHGSAAATRTGGLVENLPGLTMLAFGVDTPLGDDLGDANRRRDQGQVVISSSTVRNSANFGIVVDNAIRDQSALATFVGTRPYPGSVRNLITNNTADLAPGVVVVNNILASNLAGGVRVSGDNTPGLVADAASNIARVYNNTVYGTRSNDIGIRVEETAYATILNNVLANLSVGISVGAGSTAQTVVGSNIFQSNGTNIQGIGATTNSILLAPNDPLFVDPTNNRFYLAPQSQAIDSSNSSLPEVGLLSQVKNAVGLPASLLLAPDRDINGIARIDDPTAPTTGQGPNINVDRGAVERADNARLKAVLINPLDNDSALVDVDRNTTYVRVLNGNFEFFSILLTDEQGSGADPRTVLSESVVIVENGRRLVDGVDYIFGFNSGSNTILLTPLSGLWRRDSVYEIMLMNKPTRRVDFGTGASIADGDTVTVTLADGTTRNVEYDSGFSIDVPSTLTAATADTQTITYQRPGNPAQVFELVVGSRTVTAGRTPIAILSTDDYLAISNKIAAALAGVSLARRPCSIWDWVVYTWVVRSATSWRSRTVSP